jgi:predicted nucleic acid-binding protein
MTVAYVDTSCIVAVTFEEPGGREIAAELGRFEALLSSNLLEAELRAALLREKVESEIREQLAVIHWVLPDRPLSEEIQRVGKVGYLKGADLWHLACALFLAGKPQNVTFASLDRRQRKVAEGLGFRLIKIPEER